MRCFARINLRTLVSNYRNVRTFLGEGRELLAVVKGNAYGHGAVPVSRALSEAGCRQFAVSCASEGSALREAEIKGEIVVLNGFLPGEEEEIEGAGLTPMLHSLDLIERWGEYSRRLGRRLPCHVKVDTGMNRLGIPLVEHARAARRLADVERFEVRGLATHLASAEDLSDPLGDEQLERFEQAALLFREAGVSPPFLHTANSAALAYRPLGTSTMARPGLALYGALAPSAGDAPLPPFSVEPALEWRARVLSVRQVGEGDRIGYDGLFRAPRPMTIAALSAGYGDGLRRALSEGGDVLMGEMRCPFVGRISMDVSMVDVSRAADVEPGAEAILIGGAITATETARRAGTIAYEILSGISARVDRIYER